MDKGLLVENKQIVVPGEMLANTMDYLPGDGTYRQNEAIRASRVGLVQIKGRAIKIIPLAGRYKPKKGDNVIGKIIDITISGWRVDLNCAYSGMLSMKDATSEFIARGSDLRRYFDLNDYIVAKIINVTSQNLIDLTTKGPGLRKLQGGIVFKVNPTKVPRIIGKGGSMVSMIKEMTGCRIIVGQNGLIWINGEPELEIVAINAIKKIERESHVSGLTEIIKSYLEEQTSKLKGVE